MGIFTTYKQSKETNKLLRETSNAAVKDTLDILNSDEYSDEEREKMVDSTKRLLDANADYEESHNRYTFSVGMFTGVLSAGAAVAFGMVLGSIVNCITGKK